eukprot:3257434-Rhodomonas_salina.1
MCSTTPAEPTSARGSAGAPHFFEAFHAPTGTSTTPTAASAAAAMMGVLLSEPDALPDAQGTRSEASASVSAEGK